MGNKVKLRQTKYMEKIIKELLQESIKVKNEVLDNPSLLDKIKKASSEIVTAYKKGKKVIIFGNGGSAADAQHVAGELVNKFNLERSALPAIALSTDTSILTSIANDYDYSRTFARQVEALALKSDVAIGISTSGDSANVIEGIKAAKEKGVKTIGFTGRKGGKLAEIADLVFRVPSDETPRIQEVHITILHIICHLVEERLFAKDN